MALELRFNPLIKLYRCVWARMGCCCSKTKQLITQHTDISNDTPIDHIRNRFTTQKNGGKVIFREYMDQITWELTDYNKQNHSDLDSNGLSSYDQHTTTHKLNIDNNPLSKPKVYVISPLISDYEYINPNETPRSVLICFVFSIQLLQIKQSKTDINDNTDQLIPDIFNENIYPLLDYDKDVVNNFNYIDIEQSSVYEFMEQLLLYSKFPFEYIIMAIVYIERGVHKIGINILSHKNWRRYTLICIVVALKVWDDLGVWNSDFNQFLGITLDSLNKLESSYLNIIDFNLDIPFSVYINYYFAFQDISRLLHIVIPLELQDMNRFACLNKKRSIYAKKLSSAHVQYSNTIG